MTSKIHVGVQFSGAHELGDFVIVGVPPRGARDGEMTTLIGPNATIRSHTVIYAGNKIGANFQSGHLVMLREQNLIGDDVSIGTSTVVEHHVTIGNRVRIHSQAFIPEFTTIEDDVMIAPNVVFTNAKYPKAPDVKNNLKAATVRRGAIIGANSTIMPAVEIGAGAVIGAGSVVTHDVPPHAVVAGNPARQIKSVADIGAYAAAAATHS